MRICSRHLRMEDKIILPDAPLKANAVPSLNLPNSDKARARKERVLKRSIKDIIPVEKCKILYEQNLSENKSTTIEDNGPQEVNISIGQIEENITNSKYVETSLKMDEINQEKHFEENKYIDFTQKSALPILPGERPHQCTTCNKQFTKKEYLKKHAKIHTDDKPFACLACSKQFRKQYDLNKHMLIHSGVRPYECPTCHRGFTHVGALNEHIRIHSDQKPFACPACSQRFSKKCNLDTHMLIHSGDKPHECPTCSKYFRQKNDLNKHMLIHTGIKRFACPSCLKQFSQKGNLKKHMVNHIGEKHPCPKCKKMFTQRRGLEDHIKRIHLKERPFFCKTCQKGFLQNSELVAHSKIHSGDSSYSCDTCKKEFTQKQSLANHLRVHSKLQMKQDTSGKNCLLKEKSSKKYNLIRNLDGIVKTEVDVDIESEKSDFFFEVPLIKEEIMSEEQIPSCSYQTLNVQQEPTDFNLSDDSLIKEEPGIAQQ